MTSKSNASGPKDGRKNNSFATQLALQKAGRALFGEFGYAATSVTALCAAAGVTAGALYHHYGDKKGLFAAVAEELDRSLVVIAGKASAKSLADGAPLWDSFLASIDALLDAACDSGVRMIGLIDAPAVLGTAGWYQIRERQGLGAMIATVTHLQNEGVIVRGDPKRLAQLILGLIYSAIHTLPIGSNIQQAQLDEIKILLHGMLHGLVIQQANGVDKPVRST